MWYTARSCWVTITNRCARWRHWRRGRHPLAAAGAATTEQPHLRHVRHDGRQFDALVDLLRGLCRLREHRLALRTGRQPGIHHTIRVRMQRPPHTGPALARRTIGGRRAILLLALRGRLGRVVRGLRWSGQFVEPRLQIRDACCLRSYQLLRRRKLRDQRQDQRVLPGVAQLAQVWGRNHLAFRIDSTETVSRIICGGGSHRLPSNPIACRARLPRASNYSLRAIRAHYWHVPSCNENVPTDVCHPFSEQLVQRHIKNNIEPVADRGAALPGAERDKRSRPRSARVHGWLSGRLPRTRARKCLG